MPNSHTERCSISLFNQKMQIKAIMRYLFIPIGISIIKKTNNSKCWQGCGEIGTLIAGIVKLYRQGGKLAISQINTELSCEPVVAFAYTHISTHPREMKASAHTKNL